MLSKPFIHLIKPYKWSAVPAETESHKKSLKEINIMAENKLIVISQKMSTDRKQSLLYNTRTLKRPIWKGGCV